MAKDFEQVPHTADIKIRVYGNSMKQLFKHALQGMFQVIGPHPVKDAECTMQQERLVCKNLSQAHTVEVDAIDRDALLVDFLSEALYLSDVNNEAYLDADIDELTDTEIKVTLKGIKITGFEVVEIKAVTYHDLKIKEIDGEWQVDIVFDI